MSGPSSKECEDLSEQYDRELAAARKCSDKADGNADRCSILVPASLSGCDSVCFTYVDKANKLNDVREKWTKAGCIPQACPGYLCITPVGGLCGALSGMCGDLL